MEKILRFRTPISVIRRCMCTPAQDTKTSQANVESLSSRYRPSEFQKFLLVWTKKYKSKNEIPKFVTSELIDRSRSEARIKISNILMALTALASAFAIWSGKNAAKRGESVHQMNLDWHKQYQEEFKKKELESSK
ncbi:UPF0389 protein CG9231 [Zerene cesonia]|uniref:UPF0389 protein CG9231 n=1 Tax=Zerene cesonia TaxID=33412 RepID=UPI0018E4EF0A|nr:UPF0389 protein CG9231 [Zerene cesonia]XP_038222971.1 UPF0389 protein CG9231 [Zerene cesonia]